MILTSSPSLREPGTGLPAFASLPALHEAETASPAFASMRLIRPAANVVVAAMMIASDVVRAVCER